MTEKNDKLREKQFKFTRNLIILPFLGFALVVALLNIIYPDINTMLVLFGLFFFYNTGLLFVSFLKHYKRIMLLTLILTLMTLAIFGSLIYLYGKANNLF